MEEGVEAAKQYIDELEEKENSLYPDMSDSFVYFKSTLRAILRQPRLRTFFSCIQFYLPWRRYNKPGRTPLAEKIPWMAFGAIAFLKKNCRPEMHVFEYGSGGSTLFWASRVNSVVSVEHDREWFQKLRPQLSSAENTHVRYLLAEPDDDPAFDNKSYRIPGDYISHDQHYNGKNFERYAATIDRYAERSFDVIVVDGRARPSCIKHAISRLKKGGLLVVDNTERDFYLSPFNWDKAYWTERRFLGPVPFSRPFFETAIFTKLF